MPTVTIAARFCGPPDSGNGGYACGLVSEFIEGTAEVTLRKPPPLDRPLAVVREESVRLMDGTTLIAEARPAALELDVPDAVSYEEAVARSKHYTGFEMHGFPTCFVCGPQRDPGEGLRIFAGKREGETVVAAPWTPDSSLAEDGKTVRPAMLWAALDCPGFFAAAQGKFAILGRMTAEVRDDVPVGQPCVVLGWSLGIEGRKIQAGTALFSAEGALLGRARQTWIELQ